MPSPVTIPPNMDTTLYRRNVLAGLGALNFDPTGRLQVDALTASTADLTIIENLQIQSNALLTSQLNELIHIAANTAGGGSGGSVSVNNFPATFPATQSGTWSTGRTWTLSSLADSITASVSGSVSISNFPATQPVSGSVSVSNFPATQPVSASSLPLPTGAATSANQPALNGDGGALAHITNFPSTQPVSGSVSVSSLPSIPTGTNSIGTVGLNAGTNNIGNVNPDATGSGSVTTSAPLVVTTTNNGTLAFQSNNAATGTITIEGTVDGTTWTATTYVALASGNSSSSFNAATATIGQINTSALQAVRFRSNTIVGTVGITYNLSRNVSNIMLDNQLPAGTNTIGAVNIAASQSIAVTQATAANLNATVTGSVTANAGTNLNTSNLDVALSTRLKPADTLAAVTTVGTITNAVTVSQGTAANLNATVTGTVVANPTAGSITMSNSSVGTSSATLLAASSATKMLAIQNTSANTLYVSTTSPATATNGILLSANQGYEFQVIPSNALYCLGSAASTTYTLWYL